MSRRLGYGRSTPCGCVGPDDWVPGETCEVGRKYSECSGEYHEGFNDFMSAPPSAEDFEVPTRNYDERALAESQLVGLLQ